MYIVNSLVIRVKILNIFVSAIFLAYLFSYHEKATKRCASSLRSGRPFIYHTKMGNSVKYLSKLNLLEYDQVF